MVDVDASTNPKISPARPSDIYYVDQSLLMKQKKKLDSQKD